MRFNRRCVDAIQKHVEALATLSLTEEERTWLSKTCPYLKPDYLDYLSSYRFNPKQQVQIEFVPDQATEGSQAEATGQLEVSVGGRWAEVILYEVPLMAIISQAYFYYVDLRWTLQGQRGLAKQKSRQMIQAGIRFSEFGTRRRRSHATQKLVMEGLLAGEREVASGKGSSSSPSSSPCPPIGKVVGTSNVYFAKMFNLSPVGTVAHEWTMGIAALHGYAHSNLRSLELWDQVYSPPHFQPDSPAHDLTIALTDTFSTRVFWEDLLSSSSGREIAKRWRGLRQDSGDSRAFAQLAKEEYVKLGIDPKSKMIIYSDSLNVDKCVKLAKYSQEIGIGASFGVGTHLTNDFMQVCEEERTGSVDDPDVMTLLAAASSSTPSKALNIVIKLASVNGKSAVKISDDLTKNTGDPEEVRLCKRRFGIVEGFEHVEDA